MKRDKEKKERMGKIKCSRSGCNRPAVIYQRYSGLHLCEKHFIEYIERKVKKELRRQMKMESGDRIAVALSGGKDSSALIYMLNKFFHDRRDLEFVAIAVDEGIKGFRKLTLENAEKLVNKLNMELFTYSFAHEFGFTLDEIASKGFEQAPCTFCGVLRRRVIDRKAKELGSAKVFTAHNLDDEVQTIMINYIRGDIERLRRLKTQRIRIDEFVPRIKPLRSIPEKEIAVYAYLVGLPLITAHCPYARLSFRFSVKRMLNEFEMRHPGTKYSLLRGYERLMELMPAPAEPPQRLLTCERCGEASASKLCKVCEIIARV
ncbi:MAG: TIGR00269 family protein, partial [Methanophagales archaeon]|nr:TIGR00269 family protein [Methanophagales archaeon]